MLIGLVTVVPSSETERPWWFFFFFSPPPRVHARVWSGLSQTLTTLLAPALPRLSGRTQALDWEAAKSSRRYRAVSAPGTASWAAPGNLLGFPRLAWFSLHEFLPPALCTSHLAVQVAPKPSFPARETRSSFLSSPSLQFPQHLVSYQPLSEPFRILS